MTTELNGLWWRPEDPDSPIAGMLKIDDDRRIELCLIGSFLGESGAAREAFQLSIILGAGDGKLVTVAHCVKTASRISVPGTRTSGFHADTVVFGAHVASPEAIVFDRLPTLDQESVSRVAWPGSHFLKLL